MNSACGRGRPPTEGRGLVAFASGDATVAEVVLPRGGGSGSGARSRVEHGGGRDHCCGRYIITVRVAERVRGRARAA